MLIDKTLKLIVGMRVSYTIPERGGFSLGFGDVEKVNRKTVIVIDAKHPGEARYIVDRALIYRCHHLVK